MAPEDLVELTGCTQEEALAIAKGGGEVAAAAAAAAAAVPMPMPMGELTEADVNSVLGYPIDSFQQRSLAVIVHQVIHLHLHLPWLYLLLHSLLHLLLYLLLYLRCRHRAPGSRSARHGTHWLGQDRRRPHRHPTGGYT
jgi:hypothetical protein